MPPARKADVTAAAFVKQLPPERRTEFSRVRDVIRKHLPVGYEEVVRGRMLVYEVPLARHPDTYNGHPLWYAALASEKSYLSLHLMGVYGSAVLKKRLEAGFKAAKKKLDMGKACIRFKTADDLALDVIGDLVAALPLDRWVEVAKAAWPR